MEFLHKYFFATDQELNICNKNYSIEKEKHNFIDYNKKICVKPWGYEYLIYQTENIGIWYLNIKKGHKTSLHCHFNKDTIIIVLKGSLKIDLYNNISININELESVFLSHYNFHGLGCYSDEVFIMEIEVYNNNICFTDKNDLLRIKDIYQREHIGYESSIQISEDLIKYNWFSLYDKGIYSINETHVEKIHIDKNNINDTINYINKSNFCKIVLLEGEIYNGTQYICPGSIINNISNINMLNNKIELLCFKNIESENNKKIIYDFEQLEYIIKNLNKTNKQIILTSGCFDIVHVGHMNTLRKAKQLGDILMVCLSSDEQIKKLKGETRPINNYQDRIDLFKTINYVDYIILYNEENIEKEYTLDCIINIVNPLYWVKGDDYNIEDIIKKHPSINNIKLFKNIENKSTTNLIKQIQKND